MSVQSQVLSKKEKAMMDKLINSIPGKISLVMLTTLVWSGIIPLIFLVNRTILPSALKWVAIAIIGVIAGLAARSLLNGTTIVLKFLVATLATFLSLWVVGSLTQGYVGIELPKHPNSGIDWMGLGQLSLGSLVALLVLRAWQITIHPKSNQRKSPGKPPRFSKSKEPKVKKEPRPKTNKTNRKQTTKTHHRINKLAPAPFLTSQWKQLKEKTHSLWVDSQSAWMRLEEKFDSRPAKKKVLRVANEPLKIQSSKTIKPEKDIQLVGEVEHRCPYCLELVDPNDKNGVIECPICHTLHHADCWAVTGTCQVPHHFE